MLALARGQHGALRLGTGITVTVLDISPEAATRIASLRLR